MTFAKLETLGSGNRTRLIASCMALLLVCSAGAVWADARGTGAASAKSLERARAIITREMQPLIEQSKTDGYGGKILPIDLPAPPYQWMTFSVSHKGRAALFIDALRTILRHAACRASPMALRATHALNRDIDGFFLKETHAVFLEERALQQNLALSFRKRTRKVLGLQDRMSNEPQRILRLTIALDDHRTVDAVALMPALARLCQD
ncbi:MAG: hypothetical protein V3V97_20600 [Hyphomicrobiaceae bacterium]